MRRYASSAASAVVGAAFAAVAFEAKGGSELTRSTTVEVLLVIACGAALALLVAYGRTQRVPGTWALVGFAALAVLTTLSVLWSIVPELSWLEANRTLAYLAVFTVALVSGRLVPGAAPVLLRALLVFVAVVVGYALASRVWPGSLAANEIYARIGAPYGYWNAVGVTAALGIPPALWLGARRSGHAPANALAYPLLGILFVALILSYSRGSLLAAGIGVALWLVFVPLRLRSLTVLAVSAVASAPVVLWATGQDAFTKDGVPLTVRQGVAGEFGLLLVLMCVVLVAAGAFLGFMSARRSPSVTIRRRVGLVAVGVALALPLAGFTTVAFSERGLTGTISDRASELTSESSKTPGGPGRLTTASSSRGRYWRQAGQVFTDRPLLGTGAGTFGVARLRYRNDELVARHAHGFVAQTMADLGIPGLALSVLLLAAWMLAALRTLGLQPRLQHREGAAFVPQLDWHAERVALAALALMALVFGVHSTIDWTWFTPGPAVAALAAAGFVAGRGPLGEPAGSLHLARERLTRPRLAAAFTVLVMTLVCVWGIVQPERSSEASTKALRLAEQKRFDEAAREADHASRIDPLSARPVLTEAAVQQAAGNLQGAQYALEDAVISFPGDPQTWIALADFQLRNNHPADALHTVAAALYLDPHSRPAQQIFFAARQTLRAPTAPPGAG